ncbi:hypothetical protein P154DRAFT_524330 [Amniculicola lignicola CBS 123094]|uniref:F-box domain-containing protein n=1 Tax=Amniculicola lignicola CBS 123094 TaxID=1392246 RepID=A0A6A5W7V0_9PLEO|nr:hypothetical protein P154DRAFT_524330 [Amniculicola lignicola CBS 123094]
MPRKSTAHAQARPAAQTPGSNTPLDGRSPADVDSPLLRLPRELRDQIYHFLWMDTPHLMVTFSRIRFSVYYNKTREMILEIVRELEVPEIQNRTSDKAPWLLANTQIYEEGLAQFQREAYWIWSKQELATGSLKMSALTPAGGKILDLSNAFVGTLESQVEVARRGPPVYKIMFPLKHETHFVEMGAGMRNGNKLRQIVVSLSVYGNTIDSSLCLPDVDLTPLEYLGINGWNLNQLTISFAIRYSIRNNDGDPWEQFRHPFLEELSRVGAAILGNNTRYERRISEEVQPEAVVGFPNLYYDRVTKTIDYSVDRDG